MILFAFKRLWPRTLYGQIMLAAATALLFAQAFNAAILLSNIRSRAMVESATMLVGRISNQAERNLERGRPVSQLDRRRRPNAINITITEQPVDVMGFSTRAELVPRANEFLAQAEIGLGNAQFSSGPIAALPDEFRYNLLKRAKRQSQRRVGINKPTESLLLSVQTSDGKWLNAAVFVRPRDEGSMLILLLQTLTLYVAVLVPLALITRRIAKPLHELRREVESVGVVENPAPLTSYGPNDVRHLIDAFNNMQARVVSLLNEKDVMLGAIGHDLKTPLAALRVRIESVHDDEDRTKMAETIDEMVTTLDEILMLARLGKSGEVSQRTDVAALVEAVVEEFAVANAAIHMAMPEQRIVAALRPVLIRRALRNLISNGIIYGKNVSVSLGFDLRKITVMIDDQGPGIPSNQIEDMFGAFERADGSRSRATGGSGLGLTISRAIARSHNGDVTLENLPTGGLRASLILPVT